MVVIRKREYLDELKKILSFIALDSATRANIFKKQLDLRVDNLICFPYKYRQSFHHENENVRDLIYKGYTIVYRINQKSEFIEVIDIFKWVDK